MQGPYKLYKDTHRDFETPTHPNLKTKALKGGGSSIIAEIILFATHMAGVVILGRLLQPREFGLVTMVTAFYLLLMNFGFNGFTEYIIQKKEITQIELSNLFWLHVLISILLTFGLIGLAPIIAAFYKEPAIELIATVMAFGIIAQTMSTHPLALLQRRMEFTKVAANRVLSGVMSVTLAVFMALYGLGYWAVVARQLSAVVLMGIGAWVLCRWRPSLPGKLRVVSRGSIYALHVYGNFALDYLTRNLDKILLGRLHGSILLGAYDRGYHVSSMPAAKLVTPLHNVGLATLSKLRDNPNRYSRYYTNALCVLAFIGVFASVVLTLSGRDLIYVLLGPGWEQAGSVVIAFGPGIGAMIIYRTYSWLHLSLAKPDRWLRWSFFSLAFTAAFLFISAPRGPVFVAGAYSISYYLLLAPAIWYAGKPVGLKVVPIVKALAPYFGSGVVTCITWLILIRKCEVITNIMQGFGQLLRICIVITTTAVMYTSLVVILHRNFRPIRQLLSFFETLIRRD
jgi:PST family polysaccharide transporter